MIENRHFLHYSIIMQKNIFTEITGDVSVEFRIYGKGHVPAGCANGWVMQPFPVFIWNLSGYGETVYRSPELGTFQRPENSVGYVIANETRRSVTLSPEGIDFLVAGFSFEYHGGANFLNRFRIGAPLPDGIQEKMRTVLTELMESEECDIPSYRREISRKKAGYSLLSLLLECAEEREVPEQEWERLASAVRYLNAHYREPFEIGRLLRLTPYSRVHFYRIFHSRFHLAPQEYVTLLRIREAARLLLETDLSATEIGGAVGWENPFYFSRIFKRLTGVSPLHYRKNPVNL